MSRIILGITGDPASGKGTIAAYCRDRHGASSYRFSDVLFETLGLLDVETSRDNLIKLSIALRHEFGETVLARALAKKVAADEHDLVVIDGIRRLGDIETLRTLPGFHLVYVTADVRIRFERQIKRGEKSGETNMTFEQFLAQENAETERSIKEVAAHAAATITNDGTRDDLYRAVDNLIKQYDQSR